MSAFGRYSVLYADPPWSYDDKCNAGERGADYKYPTLGYDDLLTLKVEGQRAADLASPDATLFLWTTGPMLYDAIGLMVEWEFTFKTMAFVWVKRAPKNTEKLHWGMGNWTRANAEFCLLGVRGRPERISKGMHQIVYAEPEVLEGPVMAHSRKPVQVRDRIEELMGPVPRLELFARERGDGWDVWGLDVEPGLKIL